MGTSPPSVLRLIRSDIAKRRDVEGVTRSFALRWLVDPGFRAGILLRVSCGLHARGLVRAARLVGAVAYLRYKIAVDPAARIGERLLLRRAFGVVLVNAPVLGSDVTLSEITSIGEASLAGPVEGPAVLGDCVVVAPGSYIVAGVRVGDGAFVGANSLVEQDVPSSASGGAGVAVPDAEDASNADALLPVRRRPPGLRDTWALIAGDLSNRSRYKHRPVPRLLLELPLTPGALSTLGYRVSHYSWHHRLRWLAHLIRWWDTLLLSSDIHPAAEIGPGLFMFHAASVAVGPGVRLGSGVFLCAHTSVDRSPSGPDAQAGSPAVGDGTFIGDRARLLGPARIGERCLIAATTTVAGETIGDRMLVKGSPARMKPMDDRFDRFAEEDGPDAPAEKTLQRPTWRETLGLMRSDREAWRDAVSAGATVGSAAGLVPIALGAQRLLRVMNHLHGRGHVALARVVFMLRLSLFGVEMAQGVSVGPRFRVTGIFGSIMRGPGVRFGSDVTIGGNQSLGDNIGKPGLPFVRDGVRVSSGAYLCGPVEIGEGSVIGLDCVVMRSIDAGMYVSRSGIVPLEPAAESDGAEQDSA